MTDPQYYKDEVLTAYLDDEVEAEVRDAIDAAVADDTELQDRLASLRFPTKYLHAAASELLSAAPPPPEMDTLKKVPIVGRGYRQALAASLVVGLIFGAALMSLRHNPPDDWMDYVAAYQALYVNETLAGIDLDPEVNASSLDALSATLGLDLRPAPSDETLRFKRGQLLGYRGKALVQLAYLNPLGEPVALCIIKSETGTDAPISTTTLEGMAAAFWEENGFAFLLIGGTDTATIETAAEGMMERL